MRRAEKKGPGQDAVDGMLAQWRRERPDLDRSGMAVVLRILLLSGTFAERLKVILAPAGLAPWEYEVLSALRRVGRTGLTPTELCRSTRLTSGAMTHRLDRLEERRLIRRRKRVEDRRSSVVLLTSRGRTLVEGLLAERMDDANACLKALGKAERRELARLLRLVGASLNEPFE